MLTLTQAILNGLGTGAVYALIAVSFVIIFRATGVLNFAQPGLLILGTFFTSVLAVDRGLPFPVAVLLAMLVVAAISAGIERVASGRCRRQVGFDEGDELGIRRAGFRAGRHAGGRRRAGRRRRRGG